MDGFLGRICLSRKLGKFFKESNKRHNYKEQPKILYLIASNTQSPRKDCICPMCESTWILNVATPSDRYPIRKSCTGGGGRRCDVSNVSDFVCVLVCWWSIWATVLLESQVKNSSRDSEFLVVRMLRRIKSLCNFGAVSFLLDES